MTERKMRDVDKTPPGEGAGVNRVWERGGEASARSNEGKVDHSDGDNDE